MTETPRERMARQCELLRNIIKHIREVETVGLRPSLIKLEPWEAEALGWPTTLYGLPVEVIARFADD